MSCWPTVEWVSIRKDRLGVGELPGWLLTQALTEGLLMTLQISSSLPLKCIAKYLKPYTQVVAGNTSRQALLTQVGKHC